MTKPKISDAARAKANDLVAAEFDLEPAITALRANQRALSRYIQTASDVVREALIGYNDAYCPESHLRKHLMPLILPDPKDPLDEVCDALGWAGSSCDVLRRELAKRGLQITEIGE